MSILHLEPKSGVFTPNTKIELPDEVNIFLQKVIKKVVPDIITYLHL